MFFVERRGRRKDIFGSKKRGGSYKKLSEQGGGGTINWNPQKDRAGQLQELVRPNNPRRPRTSHKEVSTEGSEEEAGGKLLDREAQRRARF